MTSQPTYYTNTSTITDPALQIMAVKLWETCARRVEDTSVVRMGDGHSAVLYTNADGRLYARSLTSGEEIPVPLDITELGHVRRMSTHPDGDAIVLCQADENWGKGPWRMSVCERQAQGWQTGQTYILRDMPWGLAWSIHGHIVVGAEKTLHLYQTDGYILWNQTDENLGTPRAVSVSSGGLLFVADVSNHCIRVYSPQGQPSHTIPSHPDPDVIRYSRTVSVDKTSEVVALSHETKDNKEVVSVCKVDGSQLHTIIRPSETVTSLSFHDTHLVVGTRNNLYLYKITS